MSLEKTISVTCPSCHKSQDTLVYDSLNAQVSPEAHEDFLEGKINVFQCKACGHQASIDMPFLYHDMALQFCVQYHPQEELLEQGILRQYHPDGTADLDLFGGMNPPAEVRQKTLYMTKPHVVFSMREAVLYAIFRENLAAFHNQ
jgi:hypothetical protein